MSVIGGKLKFKSDRKEVEREKIPIRNSGPIDVKETNEDEPVVHDMEKKMKKIEHEPQPATGRIITSGTTVHGKDSKFSREIKQGDIIVVLHPETLIKEEREVMVVLSDKSAALKSALSSDIITFTPFEVKKQPQYVEDDDTLEEKYVKEISKASKKIQKPQSVLEYREKKGMWGYKNVKETFDKDMSREQLLDMRSKKSRDKFCWI